MMPDGMGGWPIDMIHPPEEQEDSTSIGLGGGEAIIVGLPLSEVRKMLQHALTSNTLMEFEDTRSREEIIVNPNQVKVLQHG